jgi:tripartite-type tricarboxylate transporter receptor subunit TctC
MATRASWLIKRMAAFAADFPVKPVRIITPFPPGGSVDLVARFLAADLGKPWGQQIIVDNRAGASGNIGTALAKNAAPDGYTLVVNTLPFVTNQFVYSTMPYDPLTDFAPISSVLRTPESVHRWRQRGVEIIANTPDEAAAHLKKEVQKWRGVFKERGMKAE